MEKRTQGSRSRKAAVVNPLLSTNTVERLLEEIDGIEELVVQLRQRLSAIYVLLDRTMHDAHPPVCPKCGASMIVKSQRQNPTNRFLGCTRYNSGCRGSLSLDKWREAAEAAIRGSKDPPPA